MRNRPSQLASLFFLLASIAIFFPLNTVRAAEPVVIGIPHSERFPYAAMMKNSFELALTAVNSKGGVKGRPLKLVYADDQGKPQPGEKAISDLIFKSKAVMLVGAYQSSNTLQMARVADKFDKPFLVCTAADDRITQRKLKNVYRLNPPASDYARGLEGFLLEKIKPRSMAILYENSPYGTGGGLRMMWFCREHDIEITAIIPYHKERFKKESIGSAYFKRLISPLKNQYPDVIYMVSYLNDAALLVKRFQGLNVRSLLCGGAGGFTHYKFIDKTGDEANGLVTATLWTHLLRYPGTEEYYGQYIQKFSVAPDYHGAEAFSALLVAADALNRADSFQGQSIREALDKTDITTPFGPVRFKSYGKFDRQNQLPTMVLQIIDGKFECIWPKRLASSEFVPPSSWRPSE